MGRPPRRAGERLSKTRTFRVRGELDDKLQTAALKSGRSVSEEIEFRLEQTFIEERSSIDAMAFRYGWQLSGLILIIAEAIHRSNPLAAAHMREQPLDSPEAFRRAGDAVERVLRAVAPPGSPTAPSTEYGLGHQSADVILNEIARGPLRDFNKLPGIPVSLLREFLGPEIIERISEFIDERYEERRAAEKEDLLADHLKELHDEDERGTK